MRLRSILGSTVAPRLLVENVIDLILGEQRGDTLNVPEFLA